METYRRDFTIGERETQRFYRMLTLRKWSRGILGFGAAGALAGGQVSGWRLLTGWLGEEPWKEDSGAWTGQGYRRDGLELTIELEQEGFLSTGDCLLPWDEYESGWFRCEIRLERER